MKREKYKTVVIGCGKVGVLYEVEPHRAKPASHAGAAALHPRTGLVALVDTHKTALEKAGKIFPDAALYLSAEECFKKEQPDIVVIATGHVAHVAIISLCVRYGVRAIICEKPLANDVRDAQKISRLLAGSKTIFVLNYQRRFSPLFDKVRRDIEKGKLGKIQQVTCCYSNGLYNNGGHSIDSVLFLLGESLVWGAGFQNDKNTTHPAGDLNVDAILESASGTRVVLQSVDQQAYGIHDFRIYGEKGSVAILDYGATLVEASSKSSAFVGVRQLIEKKDRQEFKLKSGDALTEVIAVLEKGTQPRSGITNGVETLCVLDALKKSAQHGGKKVSIHL